jgi:hypothetical protein
MLGGVSVWAAWSPAHAALASACRINGFACHLDFTSSPRNITARALSAGATPRIVGESRATGPEERTMKSRIAFAVALTVVLLSVASFAQNQTGLMNATIPFQFYAGSKLMPAGDYSIRPMSPKVMLLQLDKTGFQRLVVSHSIERRVSVTDAMLTFRHSGDRYFLRQIWNVGASIGQELPNTKLETNVARNGYSHEVFVLARK